MISDDYDDYNTFSLHDRCRSYQIIVQEKLIEESSGIAPKLRGHGIKEKNLTFSLSSGL